MKTTDFLVIGGGIMGVSIARELRHRFPDASVTVLEKERTCGLHASGRNSGVVHAGFYYSADSLKARFTRDGNRQLIAYAESRGIPVNRCGKLVVAQDERELDVLDELRRRGEANGVILELISEAEAREIEPRVLTHERALFSPATASIDPTAIITAMAEDARREKVTIHEGTAYLGRKGDVVRTSGGEYSVGFTVNAAGLYADRVAADFGFSREYRILPFKGLYLYSDEPPGAFRTNIYPVPDLRYPFLGVHFTLQMDGRAKIGPTALPVLSREQYDWSAVRPREVLDIAPRLLRLILGGNEYRSLAAEETRKRFRRAMVARAARLARGVEPRHYRRWGKPGIRAQLVDVRTGKLEMDFVVQGDAGSIHLLNAVSPGWTCALPVARHVGERIEAAVGSTSTSPAPAK